MIKTVIASFDRPDDADRAVRDLRTAGFLEADINVVVNNIQRGDPDAPTTLTNAETGAVAKGAVAGGVLGGAAGLAASLAGLAIPGIGPILAAGPIVAALAGAGAGAVAGTTTSRWALLGRGPARGWPTGGRSWPRGGCATRRSRPGRRRAASAGGRR